MEQYANRLETPVYDIVLCYDRQAVCRQCGSLRRRVQKTENHGEYLIRYVTCMQCGHKQKTRQDLLPVDRKNPSTA